MAVSPSPPVTLETKPDVSESENPNLPSTQPDPSAPSPSPAPAPAPAPTPVAVPPIPLPVSVPFPISSTPAPSETPNSNPPLTSTTTTPPPPPLSYPSFTPPTIPISIPPSAPSFRPITPIPPPAQYTPLPNPNFQNPNFQNPNPSLQPPGVNPIMIPGPATGAGAVTVSVPQLRPPGMYQVPPPGQPLTYGQVPNGYAAVPNQAPQGTIPPPGIARYLPPPHYSTMGRPTFIRPPMGVLPPLTRPPMQGIRPAMPPPGVRPPVPIVAPTEKPQTTVYVGKIAPTVDNEFILSLLRLCGPVKIWKRAQDPSDGTPRGFGFCEFESAEGVLRALRLLTKCNVDGLEMVLNVNQATREYLERYVEKKKEREKLKEAEAEGTKKEEESAPGVEKNEPPKTATEDSKEENDKLNKEIQDAQNFGIVSDEDREADQEALEKLSNMLEERLKNRPLPPPPPPPIADGAAKSNSEAPTKSRDGDSDVDIMRNGDDKIDDETTSENKPISEHDRPETSSPDRIRRYDRRSRDRDRDRDRDNRDRDRERDLKRDKERELERYEKERERERIRRERDRENKIREAERLYKERVKEWENRERDKEYQRQQEREKEKERERQRKREVTDQEYDSDDDDRRRRRRSNVVEEKRKRRRREKEEDLVDAKREAEEVAEAKRRAIEEEQQKKDEPKDLPAPMANGSEKSVLGEENNVDGGSDVATQAYESDDTSDVIMKNGVDDLSLPAVTLSNAPAKKLGFGLIGSGKRTTVPSVFHEEDEDEADKDKKMRPLVPIDYSTEEIQAVQVSASGAPPANLAAAAEFAKRISNVNPKEERSDIERDRSRRSGDRSSHRDRDRNDDDSHRTRDENKERFHDRDRERDREHVADKLKTPENKKLLDAKQLIDMIPKTKEELFSYEINWAVYDKHELHERMRPWISKKITEFLGEEEATLVDYIVSSTKEHVRASQMLELLQSILDDEAEMFVLKMWRMLIFEIKKVETGLALKSKAEK